MRCFDLHDRELYSWLAIFYSDKFAIINSWRVIEGGLIDTYVIQPIFV